MDWLTKRLREPSTYAGLAAIAVGAGQVADINEAPAVADAITTVGQSVAVMPGWEGLVMGVLGALAVFLREKGEK